MFFPEAFFDLEAEFCLDGFIRFEFLADRIKNLLASGSLLPIPAGTCAKEDSTIVNPNRQLKNFFIYVI